MYKLAYVTDNWVMKFNERMQAFVGCNTWETVTEGSAYRGCF